jgi:pyrophosphate--fructose-6-phosphate 1-phosphotransferase
MTTVSPLQKARYNYEPKLPGLFRTQAAALHAVESEASATGTGQPAILDALPSISGLPIVTFEAGALNRKRCIRIGVVLSGGQAPGGHNVITGLYDALRAMSVDGSLYGFHGGPAGLISGKATLLTDAAINPYRNTGGFDLIGSGRTKLETEAQFIKAVATCKELDLNAVVIVGGDDSNTNAGLFAEYCLANGLGLQVIGCPKTIDGDLKNEWVETSFGFDTATKVYSELIGNILRDANSAKKYWHFIKLMGRSASHVALECALQTHPNLTLISEEVRHRNMTLDEVVELIAGAVARRATAGRNFGVCLIPEGLIEFIPEIGALIAELNDIVHKKAFTALTDAEARRRHIGGRLSHTSQHVFAALPDGIQGQLLMDRDSHGNVQVSRIETEKLLIDLVARRLAEWKAVGKYVGGFSAQAHFFGYEGRCAAPSNFDADYCYSLGWTAAALVVAGKTGYLACVRNLIGSAVDWQPGGVPLARMMNIERRHGVGKPVIRKALVALQGRPFLALAACRERWLMEDDYCHPGPIQYFGPDEICNAVNKTLTFERNCRA